MEESEEEDIELRLKAATQYTVGKICKEEEKALQLTISPQVISALTDVVFDQIGFLAIDLEYFSKHAKRSTVSIDDVKLCARRNRTLYDAISEEANELDSEKSSKPRKESSTKKRKTGT